MHPAQLLAFTDTTRELGGFMGTFRNTAIVAGVVSFSLGVGLAAQANAWPTPPPPGCEQRFMVAYCDGPIQPDGSWQRCFENQPVWSSAGQTWLGGVTNCYQVGPGPDPLAWAPQYHIGG
jgi:hypothetical protein